MVRMQLPPFGDLHHRVVSYEAISLSKSYLNMYNLLARVWESARTFELSTLNEEVKCKVSSLMSNCAA